MVVCGLAGDYCVKHTSLDSAEEGFKTHVVEDAVRSVMGETGWDKSKAEFASAGVEVVNMKWVKVRVHALCTRRDPKS